MKSLAIMLVLVAAQAYLRPAPEKGADVTLNQRFPSAIGTVLFAGFRPIVVQFLYWEFDKAYRDGRVLEAVATARLLARIDPRNPRAIQYLTIVTAYDLAAAERTTAGRLSLTLQALRLNREGAQRNPGDPRFPRDRALILHDRVVSDRLLNAAYRRRVGREAAWDASEAWLEAIRLAPRAVGLRESWISLSVQHAYQILERSGPAPARALLSRREAQVKNWGDQVPQQNRAQIVAWSRILGGLAGEAMDLAAALADLQGVLLDWPDLEEGGDGRQEAAIWSLVLPPLLEAAIRATEQGRTTAALSLLEALHSIQALTRDRLAQGQQGGHVGLPTASYAARWEEVLAGIRTGDPAQNIRIQRIKKPFER